MKLKASGFTLLEILVALALMGIALLFVIRLFSADLRGISASEGYVNAAAKANAKLREVLAGDSLSEKTWSETTDDGYTLDTSIREALKERTDGLQVKLFAIKVDARWRRGTKTRTLTLSTMKVVDKG